MATIEACLSLVRFLETRRWSLSDEKRLQEAVADELSAHEFRFEREVMLARGDIVDFMVGGTIAIELKIKGQRRAIFRQCERYAAHDRVQAIIVGAAVAMGVPTEIKGKPMFVAHMGIGGL